MFKVLFILREVSRDGGVGVAMHTEDFKTTGAANDAINRCETVRKEIGINLRAVALW